MVRRVMLLVLGAAVLTLALTSVALASDQEAATPWDIYYDYAYDLQLNGISDASGVVSPKFPYTDEEIEAYQNDAEVQQYVSRLDTDVVEDDIDRDVFPFTGFQLMMAGIVVVVLIAGGVALRFFSRPRKQSQGS